MLEFFFVLVSDLLNLELVHGNDLLDVLLCRRLMIGNLVFPRYAGLQLGLQTLDLVLLFVSDRLKVFQFLRKGIGLGALLRRHVVWGLVLEALALLLDLLALSLFSTDHLIGQQPH